MMAQDMDAGLKRDIMGWVMAGLEISKDELRRRLGGALEAATTSEREACAVAAEQYLENGDRTKVDEAQRWTAETIAMDIRCRTKGYRT